MLQIFPFLAWVAVVTSAVLLIVLWRFEELGARSVAILVPWFLIAAYSQLFGSSGTQVALGLVLQTVLALYLVLRWKLSA